MFMTKFSNRGNTYLMNLEFHFKGAADTFVVSIHQIDLPLSKQDEAYHEEHEYNSYSEACKKFRSVFRWNRGQEPSLPMLFDYVHAVWVDPQKRMRG